MSTTSQDLNETTVDEIISRYPNSITVFNEFNIDACCGGAVPLREAAQRDGADLDAMLNALVRVIGVYK